MEARRKPRFRPLERSYVVYHLYHMHEFGYYTSYAWVWYLVLVTDCTWFRAT